LGREVVRDGLAKGRTVYVRYDKRDGISESKFMNSDLHEFFGLTERNLKLLKGGEIFSHEK
jgi:hypothetical protein